MSYGHLEQGGRRESKGHMVAWTGKARQSLRDGKGAGSRGRYEARS